MYGVRAEGPRVGIGHTHAHTHTHVNTAHWWAHTRTHRAHTHTHTREHGALPPNKNTAVHMQGDVVGAGAAVGFPVGLGVSVGQLAGPVRVGGHLHLLPALVLLHLHTGAYGPGGSLVS